jgi:hypothetical protein
MAIVGSLFYKPRLDLLLRSAIEARIATVRHGEGFYEGFYKATISEMGG